MGAEVLNQDEIDALLRGVKDGAVDTNAEPAMPGEVRPFNLANQSSLARGRMATLDLINERHARLLRIGLFGLIRHTLEVSAKPVRMLAYSEYLQSLQLPTSLNLIRLSPLRGTSLFVIDPKLLFAIVDNFFGGNGRQASIEGREFTRTENRIVQMILRQTFKDMQEAWTSIAPLQVEPLSTETNPSFVNIVGPSDIVVVISFQVDIDGTGGTLQIAIPYASLEPMREQLDTGLQQDRTERNEGWAQTLREELEDAEIEIVPVLGHARLTVGKLVDLRPGDIIPCDFDGEVTLIAEGVPVLRGSYGTSRGVQAVKITGRVGKRPRANPISH
jgi:flagellar motor switch protein FliM